MKKKGWRTKIYEAPRGSGRVSEQLGLYLPQEKPDLSFKTVREYERTKHVHRLHPYLGKFIPQLVEYFLRRYFKPSQIILDPFMGSGTTLVEANILTMPAIGIEVSEFNCLIAKVKTDHYSIDLLEKEVKDILKKTEAFSERLKNQGPMAELKTSSVYLNTWFAPRALQEILFYRSLIPNYQYQDVLKVVLSRSARSARQIPHYDLARPRQPIKKPYYCIKHRRICHPIEECLKFIHRYSYDTINRVKQFARIRNPLPIKIIQGDAREIRLDQRVDGVFTSPPYVGMIDYHEQHKYAYELFGFRDYSDKEIGPMSKGRNSEAKQLYKNDLIKVFCNLRRFIRPKGNIFVVVNDRDNLYPEIAEKSRFKIVELLHRPVLMRTERDNVQYSESIYHFVKD